MFLGNLFSSNSTLLRQPIEIYCPSEGMLLMISESPTTKFIVTQTIFTVASIQDNDVA